MAVARDFHTVSLPPSEDEIKESLREPKHKASLKSLPANLSPPDARRKNRPAQRVILLYIYFSTLFLQCQQ